MFSQDLGTEASSLNTEQNYVKFAQQVGDVLYEGQAYYNIPAFFSELSKGLGSTPLNSFQLKTIVDSVTVAYNAKVAEEKKKDGGGKKKGKEKANLKGAGKGADNARNNNPAMVADLMGGDDDYGDEYGDYGDEYGDEPAAGSRQRVAEPD